MDFDQFLNWLEGTPIAVAIREGSLQSDGEFVSHSQQTEILVRCRSGVTAPNSLSA